MISDPPGWARHDPAAFTRSFAYRPGADLPYDLDAIPSGAILMLDATVYIDAHQAGRLPPTLMARIAGSDILHSAVALSEIAAALGHLDPSHSGTPAIRSALEQVLARADPDRTVAPGSDAWTEAALIAGVLARTQGLPKSDRRKLLNDALIFLTAAETGAVLVTRSRKDMDLLLRFRPDVPILLYDRPT